MNARRQLSGANSFFGLDKPGDAALVLASDTAKLVQRTVRRNLGTISSSAASARPCRMFGDANELSNKVTAFDTVGLHAWLVLMLAALTELLGV